MTWSQNPLWGVVSNVAFLSLVLLVGIILLPLRTCLQVAGGMAILAGIYVLLHVPAGGVAMIVGGLTMIVTVRKWQARVDEKKAEELEASAARWRPPIGPQSPVDDEG